MQWEDLRSPLNLDSNPPSLLISPAPLNTMSPPSAVFLRPLTKVITFFPPQCRVTSRFGPGCVPLAYW